MQVQKIIVFNVKFEGFEHAKKSKFLNFCRENNFFIVEEDEENNNYIIEVRNRFEEDGVLEFIENELS